MMVVYRPFPTSNHNAWCRFCSVFLLYIVRFLHQTTTLLSQYILAGSCISSVSYIKPQPVAYRARLSFVVYRPFPTSNHNREKQFNEHLTVVYRPFPTSNHNCRAIQFGSIELYIVRFLHQTTTISACFLASACCISSVSYIKPQHRKSAILQQRVVYRPFPTSNHNYRELQN